MIREERRKKRKKKNILSIILGVLIVFALAAVIVVSVFKVKDVEVEGNQLYDSKVIEKAVLNDDYSWNSLYVFVKYKFVATKKIPFIDTMEISLKNPQTLHIKVYEKGIMGYLYIPSINENAYFDKDGFVVETSSKVIDGTPQILGIDCDKVVLYEKLPIGSAKLREILTLTQSLKRNSLIPDSITYGGVNEPELAYGDIKVQMGDLNLLTQKVERLAKIKPLYGLFLDTIPCGDVPDCDFEKELPVALKKGPVVLHSQMYASGLLRAGSHPKLVQALRDAAEKTKMPHQEWAFNGAGYVTDAVGGVYAGEGMAVVTMALPRRYSHSPSEVLHLSDVVATQAIVEEFLKHPVDLSML